MLGDLPEMAIRQRPDFPTQGRCGADGIAHLPVSARYRVISGACRPANDTRHQMHPYPPRRRGPKPTSFRLNHQTQVESEHRTGIRCPVRNPQAGASSPEKDRANPTPAPRAFPPPDTASGVVWVTLQDERGNGERDRAARDLVESQRRELLGSSLMGVLGVVERQGEVVHLVARRLADHSRLLGRLTARSRDFH